MTTTRLLCRRWVIRSRRQPWVARSSTPFASSISQHESSWKPLPQSFVCRSFVMVTKTKADEPQLVAPKVAAQSPDDSLSTTSTEQQVNDQRLIITDSCWNRIHQLVTAKQQDDMYLRVFVDAGGCSGFTYQFELDTDDKLDNSEDIVFYESSPSITAPPARVVVDRGSLKLIAGSKIDYVREMIKSSFEVKDNPQSESACGCGSSFALKNFSSNPAMD